MWKPDGIIKKILIGEQAMTIDIMQSNKSLQEVIAMYRKLGGGGFQAHSWRDNPMKGVSSLLYSWSGLRKKDLIYYSETFPTLIEMTDGTYLENRRKVKSFFRDLDSENDKNYFLISGMAMPALKYYFQMYYSQQIHSQMIGVVLDIELYRAKTGKLPKNLERFKDNTILDLFNEKPLHFIRLKTGYKLYSVGPDLNDEQGKGDDISIEITR